MEWLRGFTITILCVILITALFDALTPEGGLSKFVRLILGIIVIITVIGSALGVRQINFDDVFAMDGIIGLNDKNTAEEYNRRITDMFEESLASNAEEYVKKHYGADCEIVVEALIDDNYNVTGVDIIHIRLPVGFDSEAVKRDLAYTYGIDTKKVMVGGNL